MSMRAARRTTEGKPSGPLVTGVLRRKCGCGTHTVGGATCAGCREQRETVRRSGVTHAEAAEAPAAVHQVLRSPGRPLDAPTRSFMESRFRHDFSCVRLHTDAAAAESARAVNAQAYTVGRDIVFGAGGYAPGTRAGLRLLAHELTHVAQQGAASGAALSRLVVGEPGDAYEQEADRVAQSIDAHESATPAAATPAPPAVARALSSSPLKVRRQFPMTPFLPGGGYRGRMERDWQRVYNPMTEEERRRAEAACPRDAQSPNWRSVLPNCPCTDAQARANPSVWTGPNECMGRYHPGAASGYRSVRGYASTPGTSHGQQCCYDATGALITEGQAAGTPDFSAPIGVIGVIDHYFADVRPFESMGWERYNRCWVPNNGNNCPANRKP